MGGVGGYAETSSKIVSGINNALIPEKLNAEGLDANYYCILTEAVANQDTVVSPSLYAGVANTPGTKFFTLPNGFRKIQFRTKNAYHYPQMAASLPFVSWVGLNDALNRKFYLGFEGGNSGGGLIASWVLNRTTTPSNAVLCEWGTGFGASNLLANTNVAANNLVAGFSAGSHIWQVKIYRNLIVFLYDSLIIGFVAIVPGLSLNSTTGQVASLPYFTAVMNACMPSALNGLIEILVVAASNVTQDLPASATADAIRFYDGDPLTELDMALFKTATNTKIVGDLLATGNNYDSAPFPIIGFASKKIMYQSDQSETIVVRVMNQDGTFRQVSSTATVANTLSVIDIPQEGVFALINRNNASLSNATPAVCEFVGRP